MSTRIGVPQRVDLELYDWSSGRVRFNVLDADGAARDLAGYAALMQVRDGYGGVNAGDLWVLLTALSYALYIIYLSYDKLGLDDLRDDTKRVLDQNYPDSIYYAQGLNEPKSYWNPMNWF